MRLWKQSQNPNQSRISLDEAENIVGDSDGKRYGDLSDDELKGHLAGLAQKYSKAEPAEQDGIVYKINAIKVIQEARASG